jgi:myo-inositol-1(or 4)-monophosphatase
MRDRFPADGVIVRDAAPHGRCPAASSAAGRTWLIAPLAGDVNFLNGIPLYAVSLTLLIDSAPVLGVVHDPVRRETVSSTVSGESLRNESPIRPGRMIRPVKPLVSSDHPKLRSWVGRRASDCRVLGVPALEIAHVAAGRLAAFVTDARLCPIDIAPAVLLCHRVGVAMTDRHGRPWHSIASTHASGLVAAKPAIHGEVLAALGRDDPPGRSARAVTPPRMA